MSVHDAIQAKICSDPESLWLCAWAGMPPPTAIECRVERPCGSGFADVVAMCSGGLAVAVEVKGTRADYGMIKTSAQLDRYARELEKKGLSVARCVVTAFTPTVEDLRQLCSHGSGSSAVQASFLLSPEKSFSIAFRRPDPHLPSVIEIGPVMVVGDQVQGGAGMLAAPNFALVSPLRIGRGLLYRLKGRVDAIGDGIAAAVPYQADEPLSRKEPWDSHAIRMSPGSRRSLYLHPEGIELEKISLKDLPLHPTAAGRISVANESLEASSLSLMNMSQSLLSDQARLLNT